MKVTNLVASALFVCYVAVSPHTLLGQGCATTLQKHFSLYSTLSTSGNTITQTVRVDGYASVYPSPGCPMNTAIHTPKVENKLGSIGGWYTGSSGCASCYYSYPKTLQIVGVPGVVYPFESNGSMVCSMIGTFWTGGPVGGKVYPLISSNCGTNPLPPWNQLNGSWGVFGGCVLNDGTPVPSSDQCVLQPDKVTYCTMWQSGKCQYTDCPPHWRRINYPSCTQFLDSFHVEETSHCVQ